MRSPRFLSALAVTLSVVSGALAAEAWRWQEASVPDLGFDLDAAEVIRVTSLEGAGAGSLREALARPGPRVVVFEVGGVIDLQEKEASIREGQIVVAGQTAPAPGITLIRGGMSVRAGQALVQHLRIRPGDAGKAKGSGWTPDGITTGGASRDIWIDHCSATWSVDENISASGYGAPEGEHAARIFIRHCLIAEGLNHSTHTKGPHSKGSLIFDGTQQVALVGNLYASNVERNPVFKPNTSGVVVNNVMANPGQRALHVSPPEGETAKLPPARLAAVGNVVLFGRETKKSAAIFEGEAAAFFKDNEGYDWAGLPIPLLRKPFTTLEQPPLWPEGLKAVSPAAALWRVGRFVGARPAERDAIDTRIVREALTGAARLIDSQEEVGGYPKLAPTKRALDVPAKGRRAWLEKLAKAVEVGEEAKP